MTLTRGRQNFPCEGFQDSLYEKTNALGFFPQILLIQDTVKKEKEEEEKKKTSSVTVD